MLTEAGRVLDAGDALEARLDFAFWRIAADEIRAFEQPAYPAKCRSAAAPVEIVIVAVTIDEDGGALEARAPATTNPCFDRPAMRAALYARFDRTLMLERGFDGELAILRIGFIE